MCISTFGFCSRWDFPPAIAANLGINPPWRIPGVSPLQAKENPLLTVSEPVDVMEALGAGAEADLS